MTEAIASRASVDYTVEDVIAYLLERLGGSVKGVKKLMKLVFLIQYEREGDTVVKYLYKREPVARTEFFIWSYGPLSNEVYEVIDEKLIIDDEEIPVVISLPKGAGSTRLPEPVEKRVDYVARKYGGLMGYELERMVVEFLELDEYVKTEYMGVLVDDYIRDVSSKKNLRLRIIDLAFQRPGE